MEKKFLLNISAIAVYIFLLTFYVKFYLKQYECSYMNICARFCSTDTASHPDKELLKMFLNFSEALDADDEVFEPRVYRGPPNCGHLNEIRSSQFTHSRYVSEY